MAEVGSVLQAAGYTVTVNKIHVADEQVAPQHQFLSSPTIRVNGRDISLDVRESACGACSDLSSQAVDCRTFSYEGRDYDVPPKAMITNSVLNAVYGQPQTKEAGAPYILPDNLRRFFSGKQTVVAGRCCGGDNCGEN